MAWETPSPSCEVNACLAEMRSLRGRSFHCHAVTLNETNWWPFPFSSHTKQLHLPVVLKHLLCLGSSHHEAFSHQESASAPQQYPSAKELASDSVFLPPGHK